MSVIDPFEGSWGCGAVSGLVAIAMGIFVCGAVLHGLVEFILMVQIKFKRLGLCADLRTD